MFDIATIGHMTVDSILLPHRSSPVSILGGSSIYSSISAKRLGSRVAVISAVGSDFPKAYSWLLQQEGVDTSRVVSVQDGKTARFELRYSDDFSERFLTLKNGGPVIPREGLLEGLRATVIHLAPIAGEITCAHAEDLRKQCDVLSLDSQGLLRRFDIEGNLSLEKPDENRILSLADICKCSLDELFSLTGQSELANALKKVHDHGVKTVIVTNGSKGAVISEERDTVQIPAVAPVKIVDPTGAGDAFMGAFLSEYVSGSNLLRCACVGSSAASFVIEGIGPTRFGDKEEVYARAHELYEKGIKR